MSAGAPRQNPDPLGAMRAATGRTVLTYHSQIVFEPPRIFEIFPLDEAPSA